MGPGGGVVLDLHSVWERFHANPHKRRSGYGMGPGGGVTLNLGVFPSASMECGGVALDLHSVGREEYFHANTHHQSNVEGVGQDLHKVWECFQANPHQRWSGSVVVKGLFRQMVIRY
ncbi:hypothetical protein CEXT_519141 [Caerostris extrusa]|uniref:Uncharacterized protein n=1 Tax=Caerostris extrusa TaxID=172846 RepID=A0AAV4RJ24_CAEEX|nr:hypothetical protein CEXT_519141 [Caerostris extrusa]